MHSIYSLCNRKILYLYQPNQLPSSKFCSSLESLVPIFKATFWRRSLLPYLKSRLSLQGPTNIGWHLSAIGSGLSNIIWIYLASSRYKVQAFKVQEHAPHLWDSNAAVSICIPLSYHFVAEPLYLMAAWVCPRVFDLLTVLWYVCNAIDSSPCWA